MSLDEIKELAGHREASPWVVKLVQDAVEIEREKAAKVCEELGKTKFIPNHDVYILPPTPQDCAAAIRSMK